MTRHDRYLLQPEAYRADPNVPMWAHFPRLHLLLGWGPGLWETLSVALSGLRHVFLVHDAASERPPVASVLDWRDRYYQYSKLRDHAPGILIEGVGATADGLRCVRFDFDKEGFVRPLAHDCPSKKRHPIVPDGEYRVRHELEDGAPRFVLERRAKALKSEYRAKLAELGLAYAAGVGKRDAKPDGQRTPEEQAFAEHVTRMKQAFIGRRVKDLLKEPDKRPADFAERMAAHVRTRMGEIERRKRDAAGKPKRPWAQDDLVRYTCGEIAGLEARDLMFDYANIEVCSLSSSGFRKTA